MPEALVFGREKRVRNIRRQPVKPDRLGYSPVAAVKSDKSVLVPIENLSRSPPRSGAHLGVDAVSIPARARDSSKRDNSGGDSNAEPGTTRKVRKTEAHLRERMARTAPRLVRSLLATPRGTRAVQMLCDGIRRSHRGMLRLSPFLPIAPRVE